MAKRRKEKDEDEDKPFKLPKFDEASFFKKERRNIKTTFISAIFGGVMALVCFGFWALMGPESSMRWPLVFLVGIINAAFLKYLFIRLNFDISDFTTKNWFGSYAIYFFAWLIVIIVLVNPPFYDDESPLVELAVLPEMQELGGDVLIVAKITDNTRIEKSDITITVDGNKISSDNYEYLENILRYTYSSPQNLSGDETHNFKITVEDSWGHITEISDSFTYSNNTIYLALPGEGETLRAASDIKFGVQPNAWRVFYTVNNGTEINATQQADRDDFYITSPIYQGWSSGKNVTVKVTAQVAYNFVNHFLKDENGDYVLDEDDFAIPVWFVNNISDTSTYLFDVADESTIGMTESEEIPTLKARFLATPGFETLVFIIALIAVVLIFKYKKKDKRNKK